MIKQQSYVFFDIIKYPIITDKSTRLIESNQYSFAVDSSISKYLIKQAIEYIFNVKVRSVNTMCMPTRKRKVRNFIGQQARYKKAIITLDKQSTINLMPK